MAGARQIALSAREDDKEETVEPVVIAGSGEDEETAEPMATDDGDGALKRVKRRTSGSRHARGRGTV